MSRGTRILSLGCLGLLGFNTIALAAEPGTPTGQTAETIAENPAQPQEQETRGLLMQALDHAGLGKSLDNANIKVGGLVEGSLTYSASSPPNNVITGRSFDLEHEDPTLNQVMLFAERSTDFNKPWDVGFRLELLYGADARFSHSNGLFDNDSYGDGPDNQFDVTQAYAEIVLPVGKGLKTKIGKWITPLGYELVNPSQNAFYSHAFLFGVVPFAHTGVFSTYQFSEQLAVSGGFSRGWDQALEDNNNDALDFVGSATYTPSDVNSATLSITTGPEQAGNSGRYRTAVDLYLTHKVNEKLHLTVDATYVFDAQAAQDGGDSSVYGVAGYLGYEICDCATFNTRLEWFNDTDRAGGFDSTMYEATVGLTLKPFAGNEILSNLLIRPEVRFDYADEAVFDNGTGNFQFSAGIDGVFVF